MATTYNTAFGSLPGYNEMLGTTNTTGGGQQQTYGQTTQTTTTRPAFQAAQTFAQMQKSGLARPAAPTVPTAKPFAQYGGSTEAQQMRQRLQSQLEQFGQAPSRFDTQAFQQIRGAQAANLQQEYRGQLQALNEELARRGLSASSVGGGRMGDLAGQQARALASLDAELLQRAAETQAADRAQLLQAGQGFAELAGSQDLAEFEANRVAQAADFENQLRAAQFEQQQFERYGQEAFQGAQAEEAARQAERQFGLQATGQAANLSLELQRLLGQQEMERAQLTGQLGTGATAQDTLAARQLALQEELQRAGLTGRLGEGATAQDTLAAQQQQFQQRQVLYQQAQQMSQQSGVQYTVDENNRVVPLRDAQGNVVRTSDFTQAAEARKLQSEELTLRRQLGLMEATGQGLTVDAEGRLVPATGTGAQTLQARQLAYQNAARLSEQSGVQYTVKADGTVDVLRDAQGNPVRTSAFTQAEEARKQQQEQFTISQFGVSAPTAGQQTLAALQQRLQEAGITGKFGGELTQEALQNAYQRAAQLSQITGVQYDVDPKSGAITPKAGATAGTQAETLAAQLQKAGLTGTLGGQSTLERLQQNLQQAQIMSQITGQQFTVDANGNLVRGTADTEARRQFTLENMLRQALGMSEATGYVYDPITGQRTSQETVQGQIARSQVLLSLANSLGNLTPEQIAQLLGKASPTTTGGGGGGGQPTTTQLGNPKDGDTRIDPATGRQQVYRGVWPTGQWVETGSATTTTTGDTKPTQPTTTTTRAPDTPTTLPALIRGYAPDGTTIIEYKPGATMEWNGQLYRNIAGTNNWIPLS